jgi:phosphatidylserine/phosphatidylglycerophosphate/cardiolipin synthase-like enzyme
MFNVPRPWGSKAQKFRLVQHVERAIRKTPGYRTGKPRPTILISTYLLDRKPSIDALIGACQRGVSVRVILDEDINNRNSKRLIKALNADNVPDRDGDGAPDRKPRAGACDKPLRGQARRVGDMRPLTNREALASLKVPTEDSITWGGDKSYAKKCSGSCRGRGGNMHSKFFAFSRTGTARNVVMVSSSNLNYGGAALGWNDLYTMKNRPRSYAVYNTIHREMTEDSKAGDGKVEIKDGPFTSRFFPMRNARKRNDPTLEDLNRVRCRSDFGRTKIYVSMFYWKGSRGNYLASRLLNLAGAGCRVSIVYGAPSVAIAERLRKAAKARRISLYDSRWDFNDDGYNEIRTHAKYVLVRGRIGKDRSAHEVMTGSQNWVAGSLSRGDETSLNISLKSAYSAYLRNWDQIRKHSRRLPYNR